MQQVKRGKIYFDIIFFILQISTLEIKYVTYRYVVLFVEKEMK